MGLVLRLNWRFSGVASLLVTQIKTKVRNVRIGFMVDGVFVCRREKLFIYSVKVVRHLR